MSKGSFSVYLDKSVELAIAKRAELDGMTKSAWAARTLERAIAGELASFDAVLLDQVIRTRAVAEQLLAQGRDYEGSKRKAADRAERYKIAARERIGR